VDCANVEAPSLSNWVLTRLADAPWRVGFVHPDAGRFINVQIEPQPQTHLIANQLRLLTPFTEPVVFRLPRVVLTDEEIKTAGAQIGTAQHTMIFIPPHTVKSWPLATFLELADRLCRDGVSLLLSFGPGDRRRNETAVRALVSRWGDRVRVLPVLQIRQLAAVMSGCDLFISNDCGPMHLAVAAGTPTLAVFLWPNKRLHGYDDGQQHFVVEGASDAERLDRAQAVARQFLKLGT
jgi:ADP-heptose:LPS heptosyltransferase